MIIGLEVHAQVLTESKMFCGCTTKSADLPPNTAVCPVCLGTPGVLPVVNRAAVEKTVMTGLALGCEIPQFNKFDRKNYMYPDLMKGYQISQYDLPMAVNGMFEFETEDGNKRAGITRVHLEEDTARLTHRADSNGGHSLVDVNRAGIPLMEIVGEPDIESPADARHFLIALRRILRYIGASTGNMEEGAFRCDANVSVRAVDGSITGPKVEVKNMNSFRSVERALAYEVERQREALLAGETLVQETRGWVEDRGVTVSQRSKEYAEDYRYFPEPDLPPVELDGPWVDQIRSSMAELPVARRDRFVSQYGLNREDADVLTDEVGVADYYERVVATAGGHAREVSNWVSGELFAIARNRGGFDQVSVPPEYIAEIIHMIDQGEINARTGKSVLQEAVTGEKSPRSIVEEQGLAQVSDESQVRSVVLEVIAENEKAVEDYRAGKNAAIGFLIGQTMRRMQGTGNPDVVRHELVRALEEGE